MTKNVMHEEDDPEHPGKKKTWIEQKEITYINIRQKKMGAKVSISCKAELKAILEKYKYRMPHLEDQVINRYIKEVAQLAGLTDKVEIETTKGGTPKKELVEKYLRHHEGHRSLLSEDAEEVYQGRQPGGGEEADGQVRLFQIIHFFSVFLQKLYYLCTKVGKRCS